MFKCFEVYFRWVPLRYHPIYMALDSLWCQDLSIQVQVNKFTPTDAQNTMGTKLMLFTPETNDCR